MFTQKDLQQIADKGARIDEINRQIKHFQNGFPPSDITMPATPGKGILCLTDGNERHFQDVFRNNAPDFHITRFIPASGAATRMFQSLFGAMDKLEGKSREKQQMWIDNKPELAGFFETLEQYPFF